MNNRIQQLRQKIHELERELETAVHEQAEDFRYRLKGRRVLFEEGIRKQHKQLKVRWYRWFADTELRHILSAPFIYTMIVPIVVLDLFLLIFQHSCFRLYRIPRVSRADYIVVDRHRLSYLNLFEKVNCVYCGYANGLFAYAVEIASRTEQYWCPIKHARRIRSSPPRYAEFVEYGDGETFQKRRAYYRKNLTTQEISNPLENQGD